MAERQIDPSRLQGEALRRWYLRSPQDLEQERQAAQARRYDEFFRATPSADIDPGNSRRPASPVWDADPSISLNLGTAGTDIDPEISWVSAGANRWRRVNVSSTPSTSNSRALSAPGNAGDGSSRASPAAPLSPPRPDPSRTDVFQRGADGKLHPIPGWHTTGPFEAGAWSHNINWGGVGKDLGDIASGAADFMGLGASAAALVKELGYDIGPAVVRGIVHGHHPYPRFMGGPAEQELARLHQSLHSKFHDELGAGLKEAGFPPVGGVRGSTDEWAKHFNDIPGSLDKATEVLRDVTRNFDKKNGTWITRYLDKALPKEKLPPPGA